MAELDATEFLSRSLLNGTAIREREHMSAEDLRNAATAQHWAAESFRVLTLDSLWTQELGSRHLDPREALEAANIGESLRDAWLRLTAPDTLEWQHRYVQVSAEMWRELPVSSMDKALEDYGGPFGLAHVAFGQLEEHREDEAEQLAEKVETLRRGTWTPGDLSPKVRCALFAAAGLTFYVLGQPDPANILIGIFAAGPCPGLVFAASKEGE